MDQSAELVQAPVGDGDPVHLRDRLVLELLYATGVRVGELCGLDVDDVDRSRRVVRVFGKGAKERAVPFGAPAEVALADWLGSGRPALATRPMVADRTVPCAAPTCRPLAADSGSSAPRAISSRTDSSGDSENRGKTTI